MRFFAFDGTVGAVIAMIRRNSTVVLFLLLITPSCERTPPAAHSKPTGITDISEAPSDWPAECSYKDAMLHMTAFDHALRAHVEEVVASSASWSTDCTELGRQIGKLEPAASKFRTLSEELIPWGKALPPVCKNAALKLLGETLGMKVYEEHMRVVLSQMPNPLTPCRAQPGFSEIEARAFYLPQKKRK